MIVHQPIKPEPFNNLQVDTYPTCNVFKLNGHLITASGHISHLQCIQLNGYVNNLQVDTYPTCNVFS